MGMLRIFTVGSFGDTSASFSAMDHGHANAVADAIKYLSETVLPQAIANDHACHSENMFPEKGFKK